MSPLRQALRSLRRVPWYALTVVGVTALALAFGTTTFAAVDGVLFKPLPYPRSSELYYVSGGFQRGQHSGIAVAPRNLRDWAAAAPDAGMTAFMAGSGGAGNDDLRGWNPVVSLVDEHFFDVLGVQPLIGDFQRQDFESAETVSPAIISYGAWQRVFGGRPDIIGQPVPVPGASGYRIVGVLPRDFLFPAPGRFQPDLLSPLVISAAQRNDLHNRSVYGLARLPPTKPLSEYQARMDASALAEAAEWVPAANEGTPVFTRVGLGPLETFLTGQQRPVFLLVFAAAATLVVLGCVNLSGLMASRVQDRARELAVRQALGAGPRQLAVLLLAESACVTAAGGLLGLALARPLTALTLRLLPDNLGLLKPTVLDWRVVAFVAALSAIASVVTSLWPIHRSRRVAAAPAMTDGAQPTRRVRSTGHFVIVAAQLALGVVLTLGGALLVGSLVRVWRTDPGFQADRLLALKGFVSGRSVPARAEAIDAFSRELQRLPGVATVSATESPLLSHGVLMTLVDGASYPVTQGFFETAGLTLLDGRWLAPAEVDSGARVAVVSALVAKKLAPDGRVIGRQIKGYPNRVAQLFTVVGVVRDARFGSWDIDQLGEVYAPYKAAADDRASVSVLVRAAPGSSDVVAPLTARLTGAGLGVRIRSVATAENLLDETVRGRRLDSWLFGGFAVVALVIVSVGILGLMAMTIARRTREIGVRMALGAQRGAVVSLLLREQLPAVTVGLGAGGLMSLWVVTLVKAYLYELTAYDPRVWSMAIAVLFVAAAVGALVPSIRASHVDPVTALRVE